MAKRNREHRALRTEKERQDWLISEYDLELKELRAELDEALDMCATLLEALRKLLRPEAAEKEEKSNV